MNTYTIYFREDGKWIPKFNVRAHTADQARSNVWYRRNHSGRPIAWLDIKATRTTLPLNPYDEKEEATR